MEVVEDEDGRPLVGDPLEEGPPGGELLLALAARAPGPGRRGRPGTGRSSAARTRPARTAPGRPPGAAGPTSGASPPPMPGPGADHLGERPERESLAVGGRAGLVPPDLLDDAVDVLLQLPGDPALAHAGLAEDREQADRPLLAHVRRAAPSRWRACCRVRRAGPRGRRSCPGRGAGRRRGGPPRRTRDAASRGAPAVPAGLKAIEPRAIRWVASSTRTAPGHAAPWSRDAVLTTSPATIPWPTAPTVTAASPVTTPPRAERPVAGPAPMPRPPTAATRSRAARDGALGVVLVRHRRPPDRHDRVADELLERAAVARDQRSAGLEVAVEEVADLLRVAPGGERR